jgi:iron-sulfur cluster repair protein YtfE (RIC family)
MCEYCDCRSHTEITELSADHEELSRLVGHLRAAVRANDRAEAGRLVAAMHERLSGHAAREERGVFPELRTQVGADYVAMFEEDHASIHDLLDRAAGDAWAWASIELGDRLSDHILREESDLFPAAHQLLTSDQWSRLDGQRTQTRSLT